MIQVATQTVVMSQASVVMALLVMALEHHRFVGVWAVGYAQDHGVEQFLEMIWGLLCPFPPV